MIEYTITQKCNSGGCCDSFVYTQIPEDNNMYHHYREPSLRIRITVRLLLTLMCTFAAAYVPCFGVVVSLLGCFTVTILSFVLPPLLHLMLVTRPLMLPMQSTLAISQTFSMKKTDSFWEYHDKDFISPQKQYYIDIALTVCGLAICVIGTSIMVYNVYNSLNSC